MVTKPTEIEFTATGSTVTMRITPGADTPASTTLSLPVRQQVIQEIHRRVRGLGMRGASEADLARSAQMMFRYIFGSNPPALAALRQLQSPLYIFADDPEIPWEILHDGADFWGLVYSIGRGISSDEPAPAPPPEPGNRRVSMLILGDPETPGAQTQVERLVAHVPEQMDCKVLLGREITGKALREELRAGNHAIVHYVGSIGADPANYGSLLHWVDSTAATQTERVPTEDMFRQLGSQPVVFLDTRRSATGEPAAAFAAFIANMARTFLHGGARGVIARLWDAPADAPSASPEFFYAKLLRGERIGDALRHLRRRARAQSQHAQRNDIGWASYVLYGDPTAQIVAPTAGALFDANGALDAAALTVTATATLEQTVALAARSGARFLGTSHFLAALLGASPHLQRALANLGHNSTALAERLTETLTRGQTPVESMSLKRASFSEHMQKLCDTADHLARAEHQSEVDDRHLAVAFVRCPESNSLAWLRQAGVAPETLTTLVEGKPVSAAATPTPSPVVASDDLYAANEMLNRARFAPAAWQGLELAAAEAQRAGQLIINTAHLFMGLTKIADGVTANGLRQQQLAPEAIRRTLRAMMEQRLTLAAPPLLTRKAFASRVQEILRLAAKQAKTSAGAGVVDERHLLAGFLLVQGSATAKVLRELSVDFSALARVAGIEQVPEPVGGPALRDERLSLTPVLDRLGRDLTQAARDGKLEPVVGRDEEIQRVIQTLARQHKNNPLLIGPAGVGKTAIVEGLAQRIAGHRVPALLKNKRVMELPIATLVAGTTYRGQFEERLEQLVREARESGVILFLDEVHTLVGAGQASGGMLDAGNILKPALARGDLHCIGATTPEEFARSIEKDAALERRFQPLHIGEPSPDATLDILRALQPRYEAHYNVIILADALDAAVRLAATHLPQRHFPDKAIDLLEEACAQVSVQASATTSDPVVAPTEIGAREIAIVLVQWTGVPAEELGAGESARLIDLEARLGKHIIGQAAALQATAHAFRVGRAGLRSANRPLGVLLFVGPSGVGKTALAYALAQEALGSRDALFRLDMSEYMEPHSVAKLLGAPPGYIGYEGEGVLTGHLRRNPHSIVLFDEIEKAHPAIFDLLLQLFEFGRLKDAQGRVASGADTFFIMTSNAVALTAKRALGFGKAEERAPDAEAARAALAGMFRLEFLNRIDQVVAFHPLADDAARAIARIKLDSVLARAATRGLTITFQDSALDLLVREGFSAEFGARDLDRVIDRLVNHPLSELIVRGARGKFVGGAVDDRIVFDPTPQPTR